MKVDKRQDPSMFWATYSNLSSKSSDLETFFFKLWRILAISFMENPLYRLKSYFLGRILGPKKKKTLSTIEPDFGVESIAAGFWHFGTGNQQVRVGYMYTLDQQFFRKEKQRTSLCPASSGGWERENSNLSGFEKVDKFYLQV